MPAADFASCDLVLSALDSPVAAEVEPALAQDRIAVVSNSSALRMAGDVPLLVPEVNGHAVVRIAARATSGYVVTNPNCSVTGLALALAPLHRSFGVRRVVVATMQAISGAGLTGPRAIDLLDNVVPYIPGEEEKIEAELGKILGKATADAFVPDDIAVAAHCHRVPTLDGHLEAVSVALERHATPDEAMESMTAFRGDIDGLGLPTAPTLPIVVRREKDRPQTRLDRDTGSGMSVVVGRVRPCPVMTLRFVVLSHNMVRGAAGGAILNAELLAARELLPGDRARDRHEVRGTALADAVRIKAAAEIVRGRLPRGPVVVVSALAGVTDLLSRAVHCARAGERDALEPILADLSRRHRWAVSGCVEDPGRRHDLGLEVDALFEEVRQLLRSVRVLGEGTPRASDALLAFGEILSSRIVAAALVDRGIPAQLVDARDVMITDEAFGAAEPRLDEVAERSLSRLAPAVEAGEVPVLGGFIGATRDGRTTTLGRGGRTRPPP
jgi:aspartate-semialdehyde dehydrogenase